MALVVCDVGPRDGLQNEQRVLLPATRAELVERLSAAGLPRVEAVSFVNPDRVPQMAGAEEVVAAVSPREGTELSGLALNERGYDRLLATGLPRINFAFAATEGFSQRNVGSSLAKGVEKAERIYRRAREDGLRSTATVSVAFGCPFEGVVDPGRVVELSARAVEAGAEEVVLSDTIGVAVPRQVRDLVGRVCAFGVPAGFHGHNTRNTGFANALAAVEAGAEVLDASVGGLGGCPFAPRASGNVATEDLVYLLEGEGIETGVDLDALLRVAEWVEGIVGHELEGQLYRAGGFPPR